MTLIQVNEGNTQNRRIYFQLVTLGGTPVVGETGQPQISVNGAAWTSVGINTLSEIGHGAYYADLTSGAVVNVGDRIHTRYLSSNTAEIRGDDALVVAYAPLEVSTVQPPDVWSASNRTLTSAYVSPTSFTQETVYGDPICLIQLSSKSLTIDIPDIANGRSIVKAYFKIAMSWSTADNQALLTKSITTASTSSGQITHADLDGNASITFQIGDEDLSAITPDMYYSAIKIILDNGSAIVPPQGLRPCQIYPYGVQAVS